MTKKSLIKLKDLTRFMKNYSFKRGPLTLQFLKHKRDTPETVSAIAVKTVTNEVDLPSYSRSFSVRFMLGVLLVISVVVGTIFGILTVRRRNDADNAINDSSLSTSQTDFPSVSPTTSPEVTVLADLLSNEFELDTGLLFSDGTPQNRSLFWLALEDGWTREVLTVSDDVPIQMMGARYALTVLYYTTNGDQWNDKINWFVDTASVCNWTVPDPDSVGFWNPISCNDDDSVFYLDLGRYSSNVTTYCIPFDFLFPILTFSVDTFPMQADRSVWGYIPTESLKGLNFYNSLIVGTLPRELFDLTALSQMDFRTNELTGRHSSELGLLSLLTSLDFNDNSFTAGSLPSELGR